MDQKMYAKVLIVDDDHAHRMMLRNMLEDWSYDVQEASSGEEAVSFLSRVPFDAVLMDLRMKGMDGIETTLRILRDNPVLPVIIMTAYSSIPSAVEALKSGASDYLTKPLDFDLLKRTLERSLEQVKLRVENEALRQQLVRLQVSDMIGQSEAMKQLFEMIAVVAPTEATVFITGESGTGKGLVARAIHRNSHRHGNPLVEVNCAALPETLLESELFGHEKGAFTGADRQRPGRFAQADKGTIFLDEIGELTLPMQVKLLRVLQEGEIQRVGSDNSIHVDVRIIAATNRQVEEMLAQGRFREDLYYRLNVVKIDVPPLRERPEDIPLLARYFWECFAEKNRKVVQGIPPRTMNLLTRHKWPGNIRELENVIERAVILVQGETLSQKELPLEFEALADPQALDDVKLEKEGLRPGMEDVTLETMERKLIFHVMKNTGGNKSEAARRLGITRRTLRLKLEKYAHQKKE